MELLVLNCRFPYTHTHEHVLVVISLMVIFFVFVCGTTNPLVLGKNSVPIFIFIRLHSDRLTCYIPDSSLDSVILTNS